MKLAATPFMARPSTQVGCIRSSGVRGRKRAVAITFCSRFNCEREPASSGVFELVDEPRGLERFMVDFIESRNAIVPFQKCGGASHQFHGAGIQLPDWIEYGMIVCVQNVFLKLGMPRNVNLADAMMRHVVQI